MRKRELWLHVIFGNKKTMEMGGETEILRMSLGVMGGEMESDKHGDDGNW